MTIGTVANNPNLIFRCVVTNPNTSAPGGLKIGTVTGGNNAYAFDCDVFLTGASGTGTALALNSTNSSAIACRIETSGTSGSITGITLGGAGSTVADCVVIGAGGLSGITAIGGIVMNCTVVGYIDGIKASGAIATLLVNNLITDNTTRAINNALVSNPTINFYNRLRDPITINSATNWTTATSLGNVTIDGAAFSDYVNAAAGDYRLATGSPAIGAAQPASASMGALQKAVSAAAQVSYGHAS